MPYLMNAKFGYPKWGESNELKYKDIIILLQNYNKKLMI